MKRTEEKAGRRLTASYYTLGCKLNFAETSTVGKIMAQMGIERAHRGEVPDICVVNTCSVTETADKKGRSLIRRLHRTYPEALIVVTGCYAQLKPREVESLEGVGIVAGSAEKLRIAEYLERWLRERRQIVELTPTKDILEFTPSCERGDRTRYFLKVQDGCDYYCSYCTIPYARGRSRSGSIEALREQAKLVAAEGGKEIVLTGVNIGCFGLDTGEEFLELLKRLDEIEGIERYRISSIEPNLLTPEIIEWTARESRAFMPHFHIPLQSGSDAVLKIMRRRYDTTLFAERVGTIRENLPDAFIGVDVITGARGETPEEFAKSKEFIESLAISRLHIFPYSERPGTLALSLDGTVSQEEKHQRAAELQEVSAAKLRGFMQRMLGTERPVLWEHTISGSGTMTGLTDNYLRVSGPERPELLNKTNIVRLESISEEMNETIIVDSLEFRV
ncbi:MAG: tRNA (N(6)-L-threonylcarbamoyladenosine(37)-C(2))-methylthiotransferase MtaB [Clostridium sp.]|nr:tRNA (N(6)-L-threonylcarbamoyladenosine(37)-C(2))-methylthiotransferase MtaB [Prevotella sp.]MCM1428889.1 tRNA (N(6)-L-threonylcarbamoyladenosine(37)-C(2))-methylthiotransferase MtaB [Clostridium sp.]